MTCYDKALYYLGVREYSRRELQEKLREKYKRAEIDAALDRLQEENYLSDERFAEVYLRSRLKKSPEGKGLLAQRLMMKGLMAEDAKAAVEKYFDDNSEEISRIYEDYSNRVIEKKGEIKGKAFLQRKGIRRQGFQDMQAQESL